MDRIALIFDFDDTLAPDSTSSFLESIGVDTKDFWGKKVKTLLDEDWDPIPAYLYKMIEASKEGKSITKEKLKAFGKRINFNEGVKRFFPYIKSTFEKKYPDISIEYYMISSGVGEIIRHTEIAKHFTQIWASDFEYDHKGEILFPKKIVSFTDKTRYIFHVSKGIIGEKSMANPFEVNKKVAEEKLRIPFANMIFTGDGYTDIPCFSMIKRNGGIAFGVYDREHHDKFGRAWGFIEEGRVTNLHSANYKKGSDLCNSIEMGLESICRKIELRKAIYQG
ncbi:MAG TPA: hydrolase [Cytophagales bacterium]|jgi:2-hydroxy-3-keto-5-methylthiopentenyl-1-phosphate phosphatase|nr:hydrolase [Cytophagales bacterium]